MTRKVPARTPFHETIREISDRIVEAQSRITILNAIKWDRSIKEQFFKGKFKALPAVNKAYYEKNPLAFDPVQKREEFLTIMREADRKLGRISGVSQMIRRMCSEYLSVIDMLEARGTPLFNEISEQLYGSAADVFYAGGPNVHNLS